MSAAGEEQLGFGFPRAPRPASSSREVRYIARMWPELVPALTSETDSVYTAVLYHRSSGVSCYRIGKKRHLLNGEVVSTYHLVRTSGGAWSPVS